MFEALLAASVISLLSLTGAFIFGKRESLTESHHYVLPAAVGIFLGIVFFDLIPETLEASATWGPITIMGGFLAFYLLSHILDTFHHHHHNHSDACMSSKGALMLLMGDGVHNFADGIVIASAFMLDPTIGILTTIGIALHEVPQEIAEYGVLVRSGCTRHKAALYNFISSLSVVLGVLLTFLFAETFGAYLFILTGIAAGNLLYIATADFIPELRESHRDHFIKTFLVTLISIGAIALLITYTHSLGDTHDAHDDVVHETPAL